MSPLVDSHYRHVRQGILPRARAIAQSAGRSLQMRQYFSRRPYRSAPVEAGRLLPCLERGDRLTQFFDLGSAVGRHGD